MINQELARILDEIADLMEIRGEDEDNAFRINAYRKVARIISDLTEDVSELAKRGELQKVPGIGKGTAERIQQYLADGKIAVHEELRSKLPAGLPDLLRIPGLGPKKVAKLHKDLKVTDIETLKSAIAAGKVEHLEGFGHKSVEKIIEGIEFLAHAGPHDGFAGNGGDREGRSASGVAIQLGEDDAGDADRFMKRAGLHRRVLSDRSVRHEQDFGGMGDLPDLL